LGPTHFFGDYLHHTPGMSEAGPHAVNVVVMAAGSVAALLGIALAWFFYVRAPAVPLLLAFALRRPYKLSLNKFFLDEL
jgi:NADH-quinone oxidoreductase subunit L